MDFNKTLELLESKAWKVYVDGKDSGIIETNYNYADKYYKEKSAKTGKKYKLIPVKESFELTETSNFIKDALDKVITGDFELSDKEKDKLLSLGLIDKKGKPTLKAKEQYSELFESNLTPKGTFEYKIDATTNDGKKVSFFEVGKTPDEVLETLKKSLLGGKPRYMKIKVHGGHQGNPTFEREEV